MGISFHRGPAGELGMGPIYEGEIDEGALGMKHENEKKDAKQDLLIMDAETGLLSRPSTLECVSPNSGMLSPKCRR